MKPIVVYGAAGSGSVAVEATLTLLEMRYELVEGATWQEESARRRVEPVNPLRQVPTLVSVADVDAVFARALKAGAETKRPVADQFYGDRSGAIVDPFGHQWMIATHLRDVSKEEMDRAMAAMADGGKPA